MNPNPDPTQPPLPDWLLERALLCEVPAHRRDAVRAARGTADFQARERALQAHNDELLAALRQAQERPKKRRRVGLMAAGVSAVLVLAVSYRSCTLKRAAELSAASPTTIRSQTPLGQRRLGEAVLEGDAAGQRQRLAQ